MNFKNLAKKTLLNRGMISAVTAAAIFGATPSALALDKTMDLTVDHLTYTSTVTELETISCDIIRKANPDMPKGETVTIQEGSDGLQEIEYKIFYTDGVEIERTELSSEVVVSPVDKIIEYGTAETEEDNPGFEYKYVIECLATAYDPSPEENGGYGGQSATGIPLQKGVIAVDPKVIPLGSRVYVEAVDGSWSYGYAVAGDTGGAIKGNRVDLLYPTKSECYQFGRRQCRVYVL
ncbi:MAG: G5 domain-containing protein [Clostridia bacterium]